MKTKIIFLAVSLLITGVTGYTAKAQNATPPQRGTGNPNCPIRQQFGGPGWAMTPEQKLQRQQIVQAYIEELKNKKANGTITQAEMQWLENMQNRNGMCINGVPRGQGNGAGLGKRNGAGQGRGMGLGKCLRQRACQQTP